MVVTVAFAAPAFASDPTGYLEICKYSTGLSGTPTFTFTVTGVGSVTVANNSCTAPFTVPSGTVTVQETPGTFYTVSSITTDPGSALISSNPQGTGALAGPNGQSVVSVAASTNPASATVLNYTNEPVYGYVKVCKANEPDAGLTGSWTFGITGANGFKTTVTVPIGQCSFPVQVPAGSVVVTETPGLPTAVSAITLLEPGATLATLPGASSATVPVAAAPSVGDFSKEAIVTFENETVQLKVCKVASDAAVTGPFTFTAVGTGDPSFPSGITRTVTVLPGQCQIVPGPYTNPNGTTGWRAGTQVTVSEGPFPGTAVTGITITTAGTVPGPPVLSPLPNPTTPGPAGSDTAVLGAGETTFTFTNDTEPGGTLELCESPDAKAPAGTTFTFTVSSPTPAGSTTHASVSVGSCTIVPNPVTIDGRWLYNSQVTITQTPIAGLAVVPPIAVSPSARLISQSGATVVVSIGSGDVTTATYTNDPSASSSGGGGSPAGGGVTIGGATVIAAVTGTTAAPGSAAAKSKTQLRSARLVKIHGHMYLVVRVASTNKSAKIRIIELNKRGQRIRSFTTTVATNRSVRLAIPLSKQVRVADVKLA
jgi:hypothetical protein